MTVDTIRALEGISLILADRCRRAMPNGLTATVLVQLYNVKLIVEDGRFIEDQW